MKTSLFLLAFGLCAAMQAQDTATEPIEIFYEGTTATVTIPASITDVTYIVNGADVQISSATTTTEYTYSVSGTSTNGSLLINGQYKMILELAGVNLTKPNGGAVIDVECGKRTDLVLKEGTVNTLKDSEFGAQKSALYFKGHAEFKGGGTLNITGKLKHAICAKEEIELKSSLGTINVLGAVSDGIHCGRGNITTPEHNYFQMDGGTVNITNVGSDGIDSDDYGNTTINGGAISINVSAEKSDGIKADSLLTINDGDININVLGRDSEGLISCYRTTINGGNINIIVTADGSKGIKSKQETDQSTVLNGGFLDITGGSIDIYVTGNSYLKANGNTSNCMDISVDANLTQSGGDIHLVAMGPETKGMNVKGTNTKTAGTLKVIRGPWLMDPFDLEFGMTAYVRVYKNGEPVTDYSNLAIGAFVGTECMGIAEFDQAEWGLARIHYDCTDDDPVSFKLFDNSIGREFELTADRDIFFESEGVVGMPSSPVRLDYEMTFTPGDVNADGFVNIFDAVQVVNYILGNNPSPFIFEAADMDASNAINIFDAVSIVNIILNEGDSTHSVKSRPAFEIDPQ